MKTLKTLVFSAFLAIFATLPAVAQDSAPTSEQIQRVFTQICGDNITSECLEAFLRRKNNGIRALLSGYDLARNILGDDFIAPADAARARSRSYSNEQLIVFRKTLPARDVLEWLKDNNYMLVVGPPIELSLLDIRRLNYALFSTENGKGWYARDNEEFSRTDTVGPIWLALRKSPVPDSTNKTWSEQQALLSDNERIPNVAEVAWGLTTYKEVRGVYLMDNIWVRVSSTVSDGSHVFVGDFDSNGLDVNGYWSDLRFPVLGLSSAR